MTAIFDAISEPTSKRVTAGLAKIGIVLKAKAWKGAGPAGVTPTQGQALALLHEAPNGMRLRSLATMLGVSAPTASESVNALVAKGLVARGEGPDKRSVTLTLTRDGAAVAERIADWPDFLARAVTVLAPAEQTAFLRSLVKIIRTLQEAGDIPVQRMCVSCRFFEPYAHLDALNPHHCAYVDAAFGDRHLRLNCPEQQEASADRRIIAWERFENGGAAVPANRQVLLAQLCTTRGRSE